MLKEFVVGLQDQMRSKSSNPFFGTFIVVWVIRNWKLIITLFSLNLYPTLEAKLNVLKSYFVDENILLGLVINTAITILAIIGTYIVLNITRGIINIFENRITPWVYKHTMPGEIVLREVYEKLHTAYKELDVKYSEERTKRIQAQEDRDKFEASRMHLNTTETSTTNVEQIHNIILEDGFDLFVISMQEVLMGNPLNKGNVIRYLELDLIEKERDLSVDESYFKLTKKGREYWQFLINQNLVGKSKSARKPRRE